jgi:outer membrane protein OmpA-like peptidoglycan-associated protein
LEKTKNIPDMIINIADEGSDSKLGAERYISIEKHLTNNGVNLKNIDRNNSFSNISQPSFNLKIILIDEPEIMSIDSVVIENILFDFNKYEIQKESYPNLDKLAAYLNENPSAKIEIDGHTDNIGSVNYNDILSYNRAKSAKDYLVSKGNNPENIITGKYGKTAPITNNLTPDGKDNPQGRKYNRRVEFKVLEQGKSAKLVIAKMIIDESYSSGINSNNEEAIAKTDNFARYEGKYTIQIVALKKSKPVNSFNNLTGVKESLSKDGWYRYYVGEFNSYNEAKNAITNLNLEKSEYSPFVRKLSFFEN